LRKILLYGAIALSLNSFAQTPTYVPSNGLVGWWPFNGNSNDESGNAYNGTVNGAALTADRLGATNSAYSFNGNSAFIQTPTSAVNFPSGFTISVWAKVLGANTNTNCLFGCQEFLVTKGDDQQSGRISIQYSQNTGASGKTFAGATDFSLTVNSLIQYPFPQPNWHHVVYTFDNTNYKIYLDGVLMNTIASTTAIPNLASDIVFGKMPNNITYPYYFNGDLDDIGIWDRALTYCEVNNLYNDQLINGTDTRTECNSYTWIDGNTFTASNNSSTFNIVGGAANGCDSLVTLDLTIVNATSGTDTRTECNSYTWIDGINYSANNNTATFNIVGGATNGCDSLVTLDLTINNVTDITTSSSGAIITANNLGATYQWLDCDNSNATIPGEAGQSYTAVANGNYAVELTENGCIDTSACVNIITTAILENNFGSEFNIYPNPTKGNFSVDLDKTYNSILITITDLSGRLIESKEYNGTKLLNLKIDEPAGIYLLKIETGNQKAVIRLVKE
jgi:hypothetical protein